jgi:hypothetical protein
MASAMMICSRSLFPFSERKSARPIPFEANRTAKDPRDTAEVRGVTFALRAGWRCAVRRWLWVPLLLAGTSIEASPLTLTFAVSGQFTPAGEATSSAFETTFALTFETSLFDVHDLDSATMLVWNLERIGQRAELDVEFGLPLPDDPAFNVTAPHDGTPHLHLDVSPLRVIASNSAPESVQLNWNTTTHDGYVGTVKFLISGSREVDLSGIPMGADWLTAVLAAGPNPFVLRYERQIDGVYLAESGTYTGTAALLPDAIRVSEPSTLVLLVCALLLWRQHDVPA